MSSKRCRIRFRSGDLISAVDEVNCDDEVSVANKTKPDNQNLGVAVFVRLIGITPQNAFAPTGFSLVCTGAYHNVLGSFNEVDIKELCTLAHLPIHHERVAAGHDIHTHLSGGRRTIRHNKVECLSILRQTSAQFLTCEANPML